MSEELQLRMGSKLPDMSQDDPKDVAVKLRIEDLQEGLSKKAVIRAIRKTVERNLGQDEKANVEYLEVTIKMLVGRPHPWKDQVAKRRVKMIRTQRRRNWKSEKHWFSK